MPKKNFLAAKNRTVIIVVRKEDHVIRFAYDICSQMRANRLASDMAHWNISLLSEKRTLIWPGLVEFGISNIPTGPFSLSRLVGSTI